MCVLSEVMGRHRIRQAALARVSGLRPGTIHALYHERTTAVSLEVLASLLHGLRVLTGVAYTAGDVFRYQATSGAPMPYARLVVREESQRP